jgi:hypothetical protein
MPADTPKVFRIECKAYGARVTLVDGLIDDCGRMVAQKKDAEVGTSPKGRLSSGHSYQEVPTLRLRRARTLCLLSLLFTSRSLPGDVVWKVADEGPRTPIITEIVGDDTRTIAVTIGGAAEFDGKNWYPISLNTDAVLPASRQMFAASGNIAAISTQDSTLRLFFLRGNEWSMAASLPFWYQPGSWQSPQVVPRGDDRIYIPDLGFNSCAPSGSCPERPAARRLRSISLVDGSIRDEASLPFCSGLLFTVSNRLFLIQYDPTCGGPSIRSGSKTGTMAAGAPFYRLDGDQWTALEPWKHSFPFAFTPEAAWLVDYGATTSDRSLVLFTSNGFSTPIPLSPGQASVHLLPLEWAGRRLLFADRVYEVRDGALVPFTPDCPIASAQFFVAGKRLFAWTEGWNVFTLASSGWEETFGVPDIPGGQVYLGGQTKAFAIRGNRLFRRDDPGWVSIPPAPSPPNLWSSQVVFLGDEPVLVDGGYSASYGAYRYDAPSGQWVDLHLPPSFTGPALVHEGDLYVGGGYNGGEGMAVWHQGSWTTLSTGSNVWKLREANGSLYVFGCSAGGSAYGTCRVEGGGLVPAFPGLDSMGLQAVDVVGLGGGTYISVTENSIPASTLERVLVTEATGGYQTVLRQGDLRDLGYGSPGQGLLSSLAPVDGQLLFPPLSYSRGQLRAQRGPVVPSIIDPSGRFAFRDITSMEYNFLRGPLLVPTVRVRKNLAAAVDATGLNGTRYRSNLLIANFSSTAATTARVFAGAREAPALTIPLGPGAQATIEDPVPGFLGPMAVEFDGLVDEEDAWAAIRVWSSSDGGTAGTSIIGTNPGDMGGTSVVAPPLSKPGSRTHAAFSASGDGARGPIWAGACPWRWVPNESCVWASLANGEFFQGDPPQPALQAPVQFSASSRRYPLVSADDLGGYLVRNEAGTNDGAVVPFDRPDVMAGRMTRFLPALVSLSSSWGTYRTEMTLAWRSAELYPPLSRDFRATFRNASGAWTIPISIPSYHLLEIPDAGAWLAANGVPIDPTNVDGTLTFTSDREEGASDLLVTAIVTARGSGATGDYGVSVPVFNEIQWASTEAIVPGLREDPAFRSNVAVANPEPEGGQPVTVSVSLRRASDGDPIGVFPPILLAPGQRFQLNRPLSEVGYSGGAYAVVSRAAGAGRFVAYGVVNDNVTGDGTLFPMTRAK